MELTSEELALISTWDGSLLDDITQVTGSHILYNLIDKVIELSTQSSEVH